MSQTELDVTLFASVAEQLMKGRTIVVDGKSQPVQRTGRLHLRCATFSSGGSEYEAIEQNAEKPSRWGELARTGHRVVQFRNTETNRYVAVSVDGKVTVYGHR